MSGGPLYRAILAARGSQKRVAGFAVLLRRGTSEACIERVTMGETRSEEVVDGVAVIQIRSTDFLIDADDYRVEGVKVLPEANDQIEAEIDGRTVVFQVTPTAGDSEARRSDRFGHVLRVHAREVRGNGVE